MTKIIAFLNEETSMVYQDEAESFYIGNISDTLDVLEPDPKPRQVPVQVGEISLADPKVAQLRALKESGFSTEDIIDLKKAGVL